MYVLGKMCFKIVKERGGIKELMINRRKVGGKIKGIYSIQVYTRIQNSEEVQKNRKNLEKYRK